MNVGGIKRQTDNECCEAEHVQIMFISIKHDLKMEGWVFFRAARSRVFEFTVLTQAAVLLRRTDATTSAID